MQMDKDILYFKYILLNSHSPNTVTKPLLVMCVFVWVGTSYTAV